MRPLLLSLLLCVFSLAQTFEVASVKPATRGSRGSEIDGGPESRDQKEFFTAKGMYVSEMLGMAFGISDQRQIVGPDWIRSEAYTISAKLPPGTTKEQFQKMLLNFAVERFKLKIHHETKDFDVYELRVLKSGHKLQAPGAAAPVMIDGRPFESLPADRPGFRFNGAWLVARQQPVRTLRVLAPMAGRTIIDKTGLTGTYDFWLEFNPRATLSDNSAAPDLFTALERQLGLQLVDAKAPFDVVVVDSGDKVPVEN
jgi:uncharacterized protein (TIGR03435 family)